MALIGIVIAVVLQERWCAYELRASSYFIALEEREGGWEMNAFELLKADHKKVAGIFEKLEATETGDVAKREELFSQVKNELDVHSRIEEQILYPVLKQAEETHDITLEAIQEHQVVKHLLTQLDSMNKGSEEWGAKLKVLQENVEHHVEEEEDEMFKKAKDVLSKEQIGELGTRLEAAKKEQKAAIAGG